MIKVIVDAVNGEVSQVVVDDAEKYQLPPVIPSVVSMRQARLALFQSGLLSTVDSAISTGEDVDKITWEYATEVRRDDDLVQNLSVALGLTPEQLDDLFTTASNL